jgi:hypothetical protein
LLLFIFLLYFLLLSRDVSNIKYVVNTYLDVFEMF